MKIYIAERNHDYEGFTIIGVFTTDKAAQKACDNDRDRDGRMRGDSHDVECFDLVDAPETSLGESDGEPYDSRIEDR